MTRRRDDDFDLGAAVQAPSFTPRAGDAAAIVELLANDEQDKAALRALARVPEAALAALAARLETAEPRLRARMVSAMGRLAEDSDDATWGHRVIAALEDADERTRRAAASALGKLDPEGAEEALLEAWEREDSAANRRTIVEALGRTGGARTRALLESLTSAGEDDPELARMRDRALVVLGRENSRDGEPTTIDHAARPPAPIEAVLACRPGLEEVLERELAGIADVQTKQRRPGAIVVTMAGALESLFRARTWHAVGFPLPGERVGTNGIVIADGVAAALTSAAGRRVLETFTRGPLRYRIGFAGGGKKRSAVWAAAKLVSDARPTWVNDPAGAAWNAAVRMRAELVEVTLEPWGLCDPRFAYRKRMVKAASHPTIAAALARIAGVRADDVVWDPFVGSGLELIERALLGPYAKLIGSDLDDEALAAARENVDAALGARAAEVLLVNADARTFAPEGVTLILSNPPLGWRVASDAPIGPLYDAFLARAVPALAPKGRIVWISAAPDETAARARALGLSVTQRSKIEMGCLRTEIQVFERPL